MGPRFLLDEHINPAIQRQLQRLSLDIDVRCVGQPDAPRKGTSDALLLVWAETNEFILVSEDRRTLPSCLAEHIESGRHCFGVLWLRPRTAIGTIVEELYLIWQTCSKDEFLDRGVFIPL
jgi:predicted nuclease of predicted toxin-antitoxin system